MTAMTYPHAIILFAHGSRDALWRRPIEAVANEMKQLSHETQVACAYLELTEPDLPTTVAGLVQTGVNAIRIVPMFLGVGRHAREDLPLLLQDLIIQYPGVKFELSHAIGEEPEMTRAMAAIALKSNL
ncbi:MAG: Sirohydrochlorin cobaltochelatase [Pseudomonadota bacterium]